MSGWVSFARGETRGSADSILLHSTASHIPRIRFNHLNMIRIVLLGRTGNHLFQYALGRVLAEKHKVPLVLDGSWFNPNGWKEVSHFLNLPIQARVVRRCPIGARALLKLTGCHYWQFRGIPILKESANNQSFDARFLAAPSDCMLFGYFQTHLYFESIAEQLRAELQGLLHDHVALPEKTSEALRHAESVAIHVRRQDYLQHAGFKVTDSDYYHRKMDQFRARFQAARFFVFSDDIDWCRSEFRNTDTVMIDSGKDASNPLHDLYLMSLASHHIIANSTYSWWAAWIGKKANQEIVMPDRWYASDIIAPMAEKRWHVPQSKPE